MTKFLFAHFIGERSNQEQIYFSISQDGLHFQDLNSSQPVLTSGIGTKGVRDPFLIRNSEGNKFYLIATDLAVFEMNSWEAAINNGSRQLIIWESDDLIYWSEPWLVELAPEGASNLWAPEAIYDFEKQAYLVYWASLTSGKQKIYAAYTNDFKDFSEVFLYSEKEKDIIDTTIFYEDNWYYRFSKDEARDQIIMEKSQNLLTGFVEVEQSGLQNLTGVEAPALIKDDLSGNYYLFVDCFKANQGYIPLVSKSLSEADFSLVEEQLFDMGILKKRHGGFLEINDQEYQRLIAFYQQKNPVIDGLYADPDLVKFGDEFYIYPTTDGYNDWESSVFKVFYSHNLQQFQQKNQILDLKTPQVPWSIGNAWAPCITEKAGHFYYFFCGKRQDGQSCIGVAYSKSPSGPFTAVEQPLLTPEVVKENGLKMNQIIDPSIYCENGNYYLLFGNSGAGICQLDDDLISVKADSFHQLEGLVDFREAVEVFKWQGRYHFSWSCDDTRSENYHVNYGASDSLYGPVQFLYPILEKNSSKNILGTGHHSFLKNSNGKAVQIAYQRFATPIEKYSGKNGFNREVCISPIAYTKEGLLQKVIVD